MYIRAMIYLELDWIYTGRHIMKREKRTLPALLSIHVFERSQFLMGHLPTRRLTT